MVWTSFNEWSYRSFRRNLLIAPGCIGDTIDQCKNSSKPRRGARYSDISMYTKAWPIFFYFFFFLGGGGGGRGSKS